VLSSLVSVAEAQSVRTVALSGYAAPGTISNVNFAGFGFGAPVLNNAGQTAFLGLLTGSEVTASNNSGIWSEGGGTGLALVVRTGNVAPETDGANFSAYGLSNPVLNDVGQTAFTGELLQSTEVDSRNAFGVWLEGGGTGLTLIVRSGNVAPDTSGAKFSYFDFGPPALNDAGQTAFTVSLTGTGVSFFNDRGIWSGGGNGLTMVARSGNVAPETGGAIFAPNQNFSTPDLNDAGQTTFYARLGTEVNNGNDVGIWSEGGGTGLTLVARQGDVAPGTSGAKFIFGGFNFIPTALNGAGQMAFAGALTGTGVNSSNNSGIWSEGGSAELTLVVRTGDSAPGTGAYFRGLGTTTPILNDAGQTAFIGRLTGTGVSLDNNSGIWSEGGGAGLDLVALEGNVAPETDGANFGDFDSSTPVLNSEGQMAFFGRLTGTGIDGDNDRGIWAEDPLGILKLIARTGDMLDVEDGPGTDSRTISSLSFTGKTGNGDGRPSGFNDLGQLAFLATFTDGTSGVFVSNLAPRRHPRAEHITLGSARYHRRSVEQKAQAEDMHLRKEI